MPRHIPRTALALCLALCGAPLLAAPGRLAQPRTAPAAVRALAPAGTVHQLWDRLVALWKSEGCIGDPNGARCAAATSSSISPLTPVEEGCIIDPNGRCVS